MDSPTHLEASGGAVIVAMTLTLAELTRVVAELDQAACGGRIQKIHQPSERGIVLQVRVPGRTVHVYLCADHGLARVHLLSLPPKNPPGPPQFCMVLRKHLLGSAITSIDLVSGDRIVGFVTERKDQQGNTSRRRLLLEAVPGFENIILLDENDVIVEALRHAVSSRGRKIAPRLPYEPPYGAGRAANEDRFEEPMRRLGLATYSAAVEQGYARQERTMRTEVLRRTISAALATREKRAKRRLAKIERDSAAAGRSNLLRLKGELLKANLHALRKGQASVELPNTIDQSGRTITVELDPALSPQENMKHYFKRARKLRDGRAIIARRLEETRAEVDELAELRSRLDRAESLEELQRLRDDMPGAPVAGRRRPREVRSRPREFISADGQIILVGRNPRQNDTLTMRASGNDVWLHVQHYPGSHVIVRTGGNKPLLKETLLDAAHLAMHFSQLRDAAKAPIDYTRRKYVTKPRNAPPGRVTYSQQKTIMLVPDKKRLARLLGGKGQKDCDRVHGSRGQ